MENKLTNYRNVYKSDHLGVVDIEELIELNKSTVFTIKEVRQENGVKVAGKKGNHNIAYFKEPIKPLVLNAGNSKIIRGFAGGSIFVENWKDILVELYIDQNASFGGKVTGGVRIRPIQPKPKQSEKPAFTEANFENAKKANATIDIIEKRYSISDEVKEKYNAYVGA